MSSAIKYQLIASAMFLVFLFLLGTEVPDRWGAALHSSDEVRKKEEIVLDPEALAEKRLDLLSRKRSLVALVTKESGDYEQSQTGVFEFLNAGATDAGIQFETLTPMEPDSSGQIKLVPFRLAFSGTYAGVGGFLGAIEQGPIAIRINKLELASKSVGSSILQVGAEGAAFIFPETPRK